MPTVLVGNVVAIAESSSTTGLLNFITTASDCFTRKKDFVDAFIVIFVVTAFYASDELLHI